jgi:RNA polymerase sigma factor (sigma-70 family)
VTETVDSLLRDQQPQVLRYALRLCATPADAEDAAQETLMTLARFAGSLRGIAKLSSWLFVVTRRHCWRLARRSLRLDEGLHEGEAPSTPEDQLPTAQLRQVFADCLQALDPEQRQVLIKRDFREESAAQVARDLGISVAAVKSRLHRARSHARELLLGALE